VSLDGIEPSHEREILTLDDKLKTGAWLEDEDRQGILMGSSMADTLGVGIGDKVVFMGQPGGGDVQSVLYRVRGIFETGAPEIDGFTVLVPLTSVQALYSTADPATQISVHLDDDRRTATATRAVRSVVTAPGVDVLAWDDAIPDIRDFVRLDSAYGDGIWLVLGIIVALGVVNTVLMSVLERVREMGVMMAVGMKPRQLATMVMTEGLVMGALAALVAVALGLLGTWALSVHGIDLSGGDMGSSMEAAGVPVSLVLYPQVDWIRLGIYPLVGVGFALLASLYPAFKVTQLSPIEAIRHQ
jgi:ABC-type lipoprotein release transport system permease subunit